MSVYSIGPGGPLCRIPHRPTPARTASTLEGEQTITALVPTSEILRYAIDLRSLTGGRGRFKVEHDHYDLMPSHLVDKVAKAREEEKA